jgi:hypothetical protein
MAKRKQPVIDTQIPPLIAGRYATNKYFASNQALIFIGPYLLDEALAVSYKLEQRKVPIYGYASQYFDAVAAGKVIVSGTVTINYLDSAYMYLAMAEAIVGSKKGNSYSAVTKAIKASNIIERKILKQLGDISADDSVFARNPKQSRQMRKIAQSIATNPVAGQQIIKELRKRYWKNSNTQDRVYSSNITGKDVYNLVSNNELGDPDELLDATLFARPDQMPPINITVSHGNPFDKHTSTYRVLRECHIISMEQHISPTGQPQAETYSFISRSVA